MALHQQQLAKGTTVEHSTYTGLVGEVTVDTTKDVVVVHDGSTAGGHPAKKDSVSATSKLLGRTTAGAGAIEEVPIVASIGTPGTDTNIPTEKAVRDLLGASGTGDVTGPGSATDNAIARFDGAGGKTIQNSVVTIADTTGNIAGVGNLTATSLTINNGSDAVGVAIRSHAAQTADVFEVQTAASGELFAVQADGSTNIPTGTTYKINNAQHTHAPANVTFADTARILGRNTAGGGAGEELTGAQVAALMGITASADPGESSFLVGASSDWVEKTLAQTKTILAIDHPGIHIFDSAPVAGTITLILYATFAFTIDSVVHKSDSGSVEFTVKIDGTNVTGLVSITADSTETETTATAANTVAAGNTVTMTYANPSSPVNVAFTIRTTR